MEWSGRHPEKDELRAEIWAFLKEQKASVRDPVGRIPNFVGAQQAADRLASLPIWQQARVIKCNPDSPQRPVRLKVLEEGKRLYMAVPRLTKKQCFVELTATALQQKNVPLKEAATMRGALIHGRLVAFEEMLPIDLVVVGCVAVASSGGRTGKGAGFADLELAMLRSLNLIKTDTPIVTTVHSLQMVDADRLAMQTHDWPLNWIVTPEEAIATDTPFSRPQGLDWEQIRPEQLKQIPILKMLQAEAENSEF